MDILSKVGFDWQVALANLVNFLIIFFILKRFAFKPIARVLAARTEKIKEGVEKSAEAETVLFEARQQKEQIVLEARGAANQIIALAEKESAAVKEKRLQEAKTQAQTILAEAHTATDRERIRLEAELKQKAVSAAIAGARKIMEEEIDETDNARIAAHAAARL